MKELIGKKHGKLTVLEMSKRKGKAGQIYVHCACDCGKEKEIRVGNLVSGQVKSCGCTLRQSRKKNRAHFVISSRAPDPNPVNPTQRIKNNNRRSVEDILAKRDLERELCSF